MLWFSRILAHRRPHFEIEVNQEMAYLKQAFGSEAAAEGAAKMARRQICSFQWFVLEEAVRRLKSSYARERRL
jgi:hypothetical protein